MSVAGAFRGVISNTAGSLFPAESGRYHLVVSLACPWASRCLLMRNLRGLQYIIGLAIIAPRWEVIDSETKRKGWVFPNSEDDHTLSTSLQPHPRTPSLSSFRTVREIYEAADPAYSGRYSVPVLWDTVRRTIVNNESADIMKMFDNGDLQALRTSNQSTPSPSGMSEIPFAKQIFTHTLYPTSLPIAQMDEFLNNNVNTGVYKCGFAKTQQEYEAAYKSLFAALDVLEAHLANTRYLFGPTLTESDLRLFVTLIRFDVVYYSHFKTNMRRIVDYPNLWAYTRDIYQLPGVSDTVNISHIKEHYYGSHDHINPTLIVPLGPHINYTISPAHLAQREKLTAVCNNIQHIVGTSA